MSAVPLLVPVLVAFAGGLYGLWAQPLGLPGLPFAWTLAALLVTGVVLGRRRPLVSAILAALGTLMGLAVAWQATLALDPRPAGDGLVVAWSIAAVMAAAGHALGWAIERPRLRRAPS